MQSVIPDPDAAAHKWHAQHGVVPINHMVVITEDLAKSQPETVKEVYRMLLQSKRAAGLPKPGGLDMQPFGLEACRPALKMIIDYCVQQKLIARHFEVEELLTTPRGRSALDALPVAGAPWMVPGRGAPMTPR